MDTGIRTHYFLGYMWTLGPEPTTSRDTYGHTDKAGPGADRPQVAGAPHFKSYLLGLLAKIKCSICSYQLNLWYVAHGVTSD